MTCPSVERDSGLKKVTYFRLISLINKRRKGQEMITSASVKPNDGKQNSSNQVKPVTSDLF